jgi:predicted deacetylase
MKRRFLLTILLLLALTGKGWGATIYVKDSPNYSGTKVCYKSGGWADATCSDGIDNTTLTAAHTAAGTGGELVISSGTYVSTQFGSSSVFFSGAANVTTRPANSSDLLDNGVSRAGTVTLNGNNESHYVIRVAHTCTFNDLTISMPGSGYNAVLIQTGINPVFNRIKFVRGNGAGSAIGDVNITTPTTSTWNNIITDGIASLGGTSSQHLPVFNYCKFINHSSYTIWNQSAIFNNCIVAFSAQTFLRTTVNTSGVVTFNNPIFYANSLTEGSSSYVLDNSYTSTWTVNNGVLTSGSLGTNPDTYGYRGVTFNNAIRNQDPRFKSNRYPAVLSFASDDSTNIDWYYNTIAPALETHGFKGTFAAWSNNLTADNITKLLSLEARGHEIALHGIGHIVAADVYPTFTILQTGYTCGNDTTTLSCTDGSTTDNYTLASYTLSTLRTQMSADGYTVGSLTTNYDNVPATVIGYFPSGTSIASAFNLSAMAAPYTITRAGTTIGISGGVLTTSTPHTYTLANYTFTTLRTQLIADGYTVSATSGGWDSIKADCLKDVPSGTSIATALPLIIDSTKGKDYVIKNGKTALEAYGIHVYTYVPPINNTSPALRKYLLENGFTGARGDNFGSTRLSQSNAYYINCQANTLFLDTDVCQGTGESEAECIKRLVIAKIAEMHTLGQAYVYLAHNEAEANATQWAAILAAVKQSGVQVMTLKDLASYIKTYDPSGDLATSDNMTYTRTMIDALDMTLSSVSPGRDAGTDLCSTLTTAYDLDGNPVCSGGSFVGKGAGPDIGAYEFQSGGRSMFRIGGKWFYYSN